MKKYYRLILLIITIVSLTALLVYRHEYNRLRFVLEVITFFGKPGEIAVSSDCLMNGSLFTPENITFANSVPVWRRVSNDLFVYSAFWEEYGKTERIRAIAVAKDPSSLKLGCRLWYENQEFSTEGRVSYSAISMRIKQSSLDKEKVFPYFITCSPEVTLDDVPYAVGFYIDGYEENEIVLPVDLSDYNQDVTNSTVICVTPSYRKISPAEIIEFIALHQVIGVSQFLVYDTGLLPPSTLLLLKEKNLGFRVTIVPWNFPFISAEASYTALHSDCLLRSAKLRSAGVVQLAWHQLAVPHYHHTLTALLNDFDTHASSARFMIQTLKFCLEYPEEKSALNLRCLKRTYYADIKPSEEDEWVLERPHLVLQGSRTKQRISRSIIAIRNYERCVDVKSTQPAPPKKHDKLLTKYLPDLQASKLIKLWKHHKQGF